MGTVPRYQERLVPLDEGSRARILKALEHDLEEARQHPEKARHTEQELLAAIARTQQARMDEPHAEIPESVSALIADPADLLGNRERWPTLDEVAQATDLFATRYLDWLTARAADAAAGGVWNQAAAKIPDAMISTSDSPEARALAWMRRNAASLWPYPVGRESVVLRPLNALLPLEGEVYAALVLSFAVDGTRMDVFFLVESYERRIVLEGEWLEVGGGWSTIANPRRIVHGDPDAPAVLDLWNACRAWWGEMSGHPIKRTKGRPKKNPDLGHFLSLLMEYRDSIGPERPTLEALYNPPYGDLLREDWLANVWVHEVKGETKTVAQKTFENWMREWGVSWTEIADMVWGKKPSPQ